MSQKLQSPMLAESCPSVPVDETIFFLECQFENQEIVNEAIRDIFSTSRQEIPSRLKISSPKREIF